MPPKKPNPKFVAPSPNWTLDDGVSYSLLSRFIGCRERFRLYAVEGLREDTSSKASMHFGTYFHKLLEIYAKNTKCSAATVIRKANKTKRTANSLSPVNKMMADMLFHEYVAWFDEPYNYFDAEVKFDVKYHVPGVGAMRLRGKIDEVIKWKDGTLWIQENKTKEQIKDSMLDATIPFNLQTLMYAVAAELHYKRKIGGVVYNVIRKPTHRQKKDSDTEFVTRVQEIVQSDPAHFFHRWEYPLSVERYEDFKLKTFNPLLRQLYVWWESVKHDPFSPWVDQNGLPNHHHYQRPFGVYVPSMNDEGEYFALITRNSDVGITKNNYPFAELIDD